MGYWDLHDPIPGIIWNLGGISHDIIYLWDYTIIWDIYRISRLGFLYLEVAILIIILINNYAELIRYRIKCNYILLLYIYKRKRAISTNNKKSLSFSNASRAKFVNTS